MCNSERGYFSADVFDLCVWVPGEYVTSGWRMTLITGWPVSGAGLDCSNARVATDSMTATEHLGLQNGSLLRPVVRLCSLLRPVVLLNPLQRPVVRLGSLLRRVVLLNPILRPVVRPAGYCAQWSTSDRYCHQWSTSDHYCPQWPTSASWKTTNIINIIISFWQATLRPKRSSRAKKEGTIQYGYGKWGTYARVFSQTLVNGTARMK